jgi:hypothetical protein
MEYLTDAEFTHEELEVPPDPPPVYSPPRTHLHWPIQGKECILSVAGGFITTVGKKVRIRPWGENNTSQNGELNRLMSASVSGINQAVLGVHPVLENLVAKERKLKHWVLFHLIPVAGGFAFRIPNSWIWSEVFLVRPYLTDRLQASREATYSSIVYIQYIDD